MGQLLSYHVLGLAAVSADTAVNTGGGAGGSLQVGNIPGVVVGIHRSLVGDLVVIAARASDGGVAFLGAGGRGDVLLQVVAQSLLTNAIRISLSLGSVADSALDEQMLILSAGSGHILGIGLVPLVGALSLNDLFLGVAAAAALQSSQAVFLCR